MLMTKLKGPRPQVTLSHWYGVTGESAVPGVDAASELEGPEKCWRLVQILDEQPKRSLTKYYIWLPSGA